MNNISFKRSLLLGPTLAIFVALFTVPTGYFFALSFWRVRAFRLSIDSTLDQYHQVFSDYLDPLVFTLGVALLIAVVTTTLAFAYAYFCRFKAGRYGVVFLFISIITLFGGYLTKIYMWRTILGSAGLLNTALIWAGIIDKPITIFLFNSGAVVITLCHYTLPLAILPIYGALRGVEDVPLEAARDIGASRTRVFFDIILPQARVGVVSSFSLTFIFAAGDYVTALLVGGPHTSMIGVFIQSQFGLRMNAPLGSAMSFVVMGLCILIISVFILSFYRVTRARS